MQPHLKLFFVEQTDKNLIAILGPTNTGKTYLAFDRLISYSQIETLISLYLEGNLCRLIVST